MKELSAISLICILVTFLLSSASACPAGQEQCQKFGLDNINVRRIKRFSGKCCVRNLTFSDGTYLKELLDSGADVDDYPPGVRDEDITLRVVYDASDGYVLNLTWTYPLCREHAQDIEGFSLDLLITSGPHDNDFTRKRMLLTDLPRDRDKYDRLSIEYHFKDDKLVNNTEFIVTITSLPEDNLSSPTNHGEIRGNTRNRGEGVTKRNTKETKDVTLADSTNSLEGNFRLSRVRRSQYPSRTRRSQYSTKLLGEILNWKPTWSRSITRDNENSYTVKVYFLQASCEYNFAYYRFMLFNCTDDNGSGCGGRVATDKYYGEEKCSFDDCPMQAYKNTTIRFHDIAPGHYQIILRTSESRGAQTSMLVYVPVYTPAQPETLTESPPNLPGNGTTAPVLAEVRNEAGSDNSKETVVAAGVVGSMVGVAFLGLLVAIWCWKRNKKRKSKSACVPILVDSQSWPTSLGDNNIAPLGRKRVTIINSSDHKQHDLCIDLLVSFLKTNCGCDVWWAGIDYVKLRENKSQYLLKTLGEDAHVIILIHSKGAFEKYQLSNDTDEETIERNEPSLTGDLFPQAMVRLNNLLLEKKSRLINAYFSYTDQDYLIDRYTIDGPVVYQLMRDLHGLYSHIHGISPDDPRIGNINKKDFVTLQYGELLRDAIDYHTRYQHENPNWFEQSHQRKKRISGDARRNQRNNSQGNNNNTEQCISGDSGYGEAAAAAAAAAARQHQPGPHYDNPDEELDDRVADSSLFPYDGYKGHQFYPPVDLDGDRDVRPKNNQRNRQRNNLSNDIPLNNAVASPRHLNTDDRLASVMTNNDNSPTLPLSHRSIGNNGAPATRWGPQASVHSYPSSRANNALQLNSHAPSNSSFRSSGPRRSRSSSGRSRNSSSTSDGSNKNNSYAPAMNSYATSMNSNAPTMNSYAAAMNSNAPTMNSNEPLLDLLSFPPGSVGSNRARHPSSEAASTSVQEPSNFPSISEEFSAPAQSDTSSLSSEIMNQRLMQVNEEFDFNNGDDSGCSSFNDNKNRFYFPQEDNFDQKSV